MTPHSAVDSFIGHLRYLNYSEHTRRAYLADLEGFFSGRSTVEASYQDCRAWLKKLYETGVQPQTISRKTYALRSFYKFAVAEGIAQENPATLLVNRRLPKLIPKIPSVDAICNWLDAIQDRTIDPITGQPKSFSAGRDWCALEMLYGGGLRVSELVGLNLEDVHLEEKTLLVRGKGKKERIGFFGRQSSEALLGYLPLRKRLLDSLGENTDAIFVNYEGRRITVRSVSRMVKDLAGNDAMHPHVFRHAFATHLLADGCDLIALSALLGHASVSVTTMYLQLDMSHVRAVHEKAHPRG